MKSITHTALALLLTLCTLPTLCAQGVEQGDTLTLLSREQHRRERGFVDLHSSLVPVGTWMFGSMASYSTHTFENYNFLVANDLNAEGYSFSVSPMVAYTLYPNMSLGARFAYSRSLVQVDGLSLGLSGVDEDGVSLAINDYYLLKHSYSAMAIWRQFIPLGFSKRIALFNEVQLGCGGSQAKMAFDTPVQGTYATTLDLSLGLSPGIVAFASDHLAVEVSVGVLGLSYSHTTQVHNQVEVGHVRNSTLNYKINLLSIGLGVAFYL